MKKMTFLVGIALLLFSCNSGNKESSEITTDSNNDQVNSKDTIKSYDCLEKFKEDYSLLLTKEEMASVYAFDFEIAKKELRSGSYGEHIYRWPSERPSLNIEVSGRKIQVPDNNTIGIKTFSFNADADDLNSIRDRFDMAYKELSDKELEKIQDNLAKQSDEVKKTGKDLMKVRAKRNWDFIDGLGTSSWYKWNENYGGELAVLAGRAKFYIVLKISDDPDENKELAKKLAQKVISKCN